MKKLLSDELWKAFQISRIIEKQAGASYNKISGKRAKMSASSCKDGSWVKMLAAKPDNLEFNPWNPHGWKVRIYSCKFFSVSTHVLWHVHDHVYTHK